MYGYSTFQNLYQHINSLNNVVHIFPKEVHQVQNQTKRSRPKRYSQQLDANTGGKNNNQ